MLSCSMAVRLFQRPAFLNVKKKANNLYTMLAFQLAHNPLYSFLFVNRNHTESARPELV